MAAAAVGIGVSGQQAAPTIALVGARVIDGTGAAPIANATVLVNGGRIELIGRAASMKVPAGATRVDVAGTTIVPGLVNAHGHLGYGDPALPPYDQVIQQLKTYLRFGVTTVYALGDDGIERVRVSEENTRAPLDRARLFASGERATARRTTCLLPRTPRSSTRRASGSSKSPRTSPSSPS
jgi:imidazolonepropionase-like amidohydrolase